MFTGIIDHCGIVKKIEKNADVLRLSINCEFKDIAAGESIAVDGACLTAVSPKHNQFSCELSPNTMALTIAQHYEVGTRVNLERSLRMMDRLGGHFVNGHVEQVAIVKQISPQEEFIAIRFSGIQKSVQPYLIHKGSITVNGVSLTINEVFLDGFEVMLIPHTLQRTNLGQLQQGDAVNLEFDLLAKIVSRQLECFSQKLAV